MCLNQQQNNNNERNGKWHGVQLNKFYTEVCIQHKIKMWNGYRFVEMSWTVFCCHRSLLRFYFNCFILRIQNSAILHKNVELPNVLSQYNLTEGSTYSR